MTQPAVYMMASQRNGTLYIGVTSDLIKRVWQHREGLAEGFTKEHGVKILVWYELHETMESAISKEKAMKKWLRAWKLKTIEKTNPEWKDLWLEITGAEPQIVIPAPPAKPARPAIPAPPFIPIPPVIPCHPREGGGEAGIQKNKNAFSLNPLDSRLRGNDEVEV